MNVGILSTIGNTPLVALVRLFAETEFRLFAKLESFNPGGSIKDRPAASVLQQALATGEIDAQTTIIESSSGNMAIGLAQACSYLGLPFICVVDRKTTQQNIAILRAYGAQIDLVTEPDPRTGELLQARLNRIQELRQQVPNSWWPNQYANLANARAHHTTMREIIEACASEVDYVFCATSTCGTLRGCSDYVRDHGIKTKIVAVDAVGSVIFGTPAQPRLIPGHGAARRPDLYRDNMADHYVHVTDLECVTWCRRLLRSEAILAGGSSGAIVAAFAQLQPELPPGSTCVFILPDRGERYLDTIYSDEWVANHFGPVEHLWLDEQPFFKVA